MKLHLPKQAIIMRIMLVGFFLFGVSACQPSRPNDTSSSEIRNEQTTPSTTGEQLTATPLPPADMQLTILQPTTAATPSEITVTLDGTQLSQPLSGIAVRILFETSASDGNPNVPKVPFSVPTALTQAGWSVAVNRLTFEETGITAAELALITTNPEGLQLSEPTLLGTITQQPSLNAYRPTFDSTTTQVITKSAQVVPLNLSEQYLTEP